MRPTTKVVITTSLVRNAVEMAAQYHPDNLTTPIERNQHV